MYCFHLKSVIVLLGNWLMYVKTNDRSDVRSEVKNSRHVNNRYKGSYLNAIKSASAATFCKSSPLSNDTGYPSATSSCSGCGTTLQ